MNSSDNPYERMMPSGPFAKAVENAVDEANAAYLAEYAERGPEIDAENRENAERWASIHEAQRAAGRHGVVIPTRTARDVIAALRGEETPLGADLLAKLVEQALSQQPVMA